MENLQKLLEWLRTIPSVWIRAIIVALVASLVFLMTLTSCGQMVRVTVRDTPNGVEIQTSQNKADSSATNIHVTPNINFNRP